MYARAARLGTPPVDALAAGGLPSGPYITLTSVVNFLLAGSIWVLAFYESTWRIKLDRL